MGICILIVVITLFSKDVSGLINCRQLKCRTPCEHVKEEIALQGKFLSCRMSYYKSWQVYPNEDDIASSAPEDLTLDWYFHKKRVALNITWQMKAHGIFNGKTKGVHVDIDDFAYLMTFKMKKTPEWKNSKILTQAEDLDCIKFQHICYGRKFQTILPRQTIIVYVRSLPTSQLGDFQKFALAEIYIPDTSEANTPKRHAAPIPTSNPQVFEIKDENAIDTTLAISSSLIPMLFLLLVALILLVWIRKKKNSPVLQEREVLLIADDADFEESERAQIFFDKLKNLLNLKLSCNWQCKMEISKGRPLWYNENFQKAQFIVFITNSLSLNKHIGITNDNLMVIFKNASDYAFQHKHKQVILVTTTAENKEKLMKEWKTYTVYNYENKEDFEHLRRVLTGMTRK